MAVGLRRRSVCGAATALIGGGLCYWGISGRNHASDLFRTSTQTNGEQHDAGATANATEIERSITIGKSADELSTLWRDPQQLTRIMGDFATVTSVEEDRQHWVVPLPLGRLTWETRIVEERPGELLRWESLPGAALPNEGTVRFGSAPGDRGTEVTFWIRFDPPGGVLGDTAIKRLDIGPRLLADTVLRRCKSLAETGEIPTLAHNPSARGSGDTI